MPAGVGLPGYTADQSSLTPLIPNIKARATLEHRGQRKLAWLYYKCGKAIMSATTSIRITQSLYEQAKVDATIA